MATRRTRDELGQEMRQGGRLKAFARAQVRDGGGLDSSGSGRDGEVTDPWCVGCRPTEGTQAEEKEEHEASQGTRDA